MDEKEAEARPVMGTIFLVESCISGWSIMQQPYIESATTFSDIFKSIQAS